MRKIIDVTARDPREARKVRKVVDVTSYGDKPAPAPETTEAQKAPEKPSKK